MPRGYSEYPRGTPAAGARDSARRRRYTVDGFVAKNRDALPEAAAATLCQSKNALVAALFAVSEFQKPAKGARASRRGGRRRACVAKAFASSLKELHATIEGTRPFFVRCVKPNDRQEAKRWNGALALSQLRYMGLLQVVEARKRGYPRRYDFEAFARRYGPLVHGGGDGLRICGDEASNDDTASLAEALTRAVTKTVTVPSRCISSCAAAWGRHVPEHLSVKFWRVSSPH